MSGLASAVKQNSTYSLLSIHIMGREMIEQLTVDGKASWWVSDDLRLHRAKSFFTSYLPRPIDIW